MLDGSLPSVESPISGTEGSVPQTVVLGRRTYELLAGLPEEFRDEGREGLSRLNKAVFSRTLTSPPGREAAFDGIPSTDLELVGQRGDPPSVHATHVRPFIRSVGVP